MVGVFLIIILKQFMLQIYTKCPMPTQRQESFSLTDGEESFSDDVEKDEILKELWTKPRKSFLKRWKEKVMFSPGFTSRGSTEWHLQGAHSHVPS